MFPSLSIPEMMVVMVVAVLLFGKRLPEVGRSLGKGIIEFKKGLQGLEADLDGPRSRRPPERPEPYRAPEVAEVAVPKFEPPTAPPVPRDADDPYQD